jgi:hypothetical protein
VGDRKTTNMTNWDKSPSSTSVTHIPSGLRVGKALTNDAALELLAYLNRTCPNLRIDDENALEVLNEAVKYARSKLPLRAMLPVTVTGTYTTLLYAPSVREAYDAFQAEPVGYLQVAVRIDNRGSPTKVVNDDGEIVDLDEVPFLVDASPSAQALAEITEASLRAAPSSGEPGEHKSTS